MSIDRQIRMPCTGEERYPKQLRTACSYVCLASVTVGYQRCSIRRPGNRTRPPIVLTINGSSASKRSILRKEKRMFGGPHHFCLGSAVGEPIARRASAHTHLLPIPERDHHRGHRERRGKQASCLRALRASAVHFPTTLLFERLIQRQVSVIDF